MQRRRFCSAAVGVLGVAMLGVPRRGYGAGATLTVAGNSGKELELSARQLNSFRSGLKGTALLAHDSEFSSARQLWNGAFDHHPALIARCARVQDILHCVQFAREHDLLTAVRGGGHSFAGHSMCPKGFVIDLSALRGASVNRDQRTIRVEAGALLNDVDRVSLAAGLVTSTGTVSSTGIAGLALGGGFGRVARRLGLACDNLVSADVVTADGRRLVANAHDNADLFWALRGGGGNFGLVSSFEFRLHEAPPVTVGGGLIFPFENARGWLRAYADFTASVSDHFCGLVDFLPTTDGGRVISVDACHSGPPELAERELAALRRIGPVVQDSLRPRPYLEIQSRLDPHFPAGRGYYLKSGLLRSVTPGFIDSLVDYLESTPTARHVSSLLQLGGAISRVDPSATAYWHREAAHQVLMVGVWDSAEHEDDSRQWVRTGWKSVEPHTNGFYVNLLSPDESARRVQTTYGGNYQRLSALKRRYDPDNFFRRNANIPPGVA